MAKGKLILICQSGGEFVKHDDGTMSYNGGEANAANVTSDTPFNDLKIDLAKSCNLNQETISVKYFLPGNKRNLITVKNDKDVKRMIDFHGDAITAQVFVTGTTGYIHRARQNDNVDTKKDESVKRDKAGPKKDKKVKKEDKVPKGPARRIRRSVAAANTKPSSHENKKGKSETLVSDDAKSDKSTRDASTSADSERVNENPDSDCSSDFVPSRYPKRKKLKCENETNVSASAAASVKKRRRTPSWKFDANGRPTIISVADDSVGSKSRGKRRKAIDESSRKSSRLAAKALESSREIKSGRKRGRPRATMPVADSSDQELDDFVGPLFPAICDDNNVSNETSIVGEKLHESDKEAYNKFPWFCKKVIETNPGSISELVIGENKRFKALFLSFYASLCGFQNCRPILFLESTSMKSKYGEILLTANAIDGNDGFFPVSFAIVDIEDDNNWRWFLELLKAAISNSQHITFVFDREKSLKMSVLDVFENAHVGYSIYHLLESFKRSVKGPFYGDGKAFLPVYFLAAAHAVRLVGFRKSMEQIKLISSQAYDWVMKIESQHWASSSFNGERYNYIVHDITGSHAKLMEDHRELPVLHKIDVVIRTLIDAITDAKLDGSMWSTHLTPSKEKQLQEENVKSSGLKVLISSDTLFEVREDSTHVVNISNWSCTCLGWKETGLPCRHALAVFALIGKNPYEFCSHYFTLDAYRITYSESITPVPIDEKIEIQNAGGEKEESEKIEVEEERGEKIEMKKIPEGEMEETAETEGNNDNAEKEEREREEEVEMIEMEKGGGENEEGGKVEDEKEEGEKDEGENGKISEKEEEEDPNVLVLPPIPAKPVDLRNDKTEWDESEVETKRTVTCTKCKQPGHNKKSCNFYKLQQSC